MNNWVEIEGYRINHDEAAKIGFGSQASVFPCQRIGQFNPLCAKITDVKENNRAIIEKEIQVLQVIQELKNLNVVQTEKIIYPIQLKGQQKYIIIMEKCQTNLNNEIINHQFNDDEILEFLIQIQNGYQFLYDRNIVHRDLKPENILINKINGKNQYKLADFGTSKILQDQNNVLQTQHGTPLYAAPEMNNDHSQVLQKELQDDIQKCQKYLSQPDLFSLGIILSQLVYGFKIFNEYQYSLFKIPELHMKFKNKQFQFPNKNIKHVSISKVIESMLEFLPSKRMTFEQFSEQLKKECIFTQPISYTQMKLPNQTIKPNANFQGQQFQVRITQPQAYNKQSNPHQQQQIVFRPIINQQTINFKPILMPNPDQLLNQSSQVQKQQALFAPKNQGPPPLNNYFSNSPQTQAVQENQFQPIIKFLEIEKVQVFQLYNQIIIRKLEKQMNYFKKDYYLQKNQLKEHIQILQEFYPYNSTSENENYIKFQFCLYRLSNLGLNLENPQSIDQMKQMLGNNKIQ